MSLITFRETGKYYGTQDVLKRISFRINHGDKIGLAGKNGAGKTTLIRCLLGEEDCTSGSISRKEDIRIGYIPQILDWGAGTAGDYVLGRVRTCEQELRDSEEALSVETGDGLQAALERYRTAIERYEAAGGDDASVRAESILQGLGLPGILDRTVGSLSGGEKNILSLASALLARPELLVLDEPGNHLDYIGLAWLEKYLRSFPGAILIVSHNRYLLDRIVDRIFELQDGTLTEYAGNYSRYRMTKLRNAVAGQAGYKADQKKIERLEELVKRFEEIARRTADPAWGKRLRSRRTQLARARENAVEKPKIDSSAIRVDFADEKTRADIAVCVRNYSRSAGGRTLFTNASLEITCGERVALVGPNGSGKTTFIRDLLAKASWDNPDFRIGPSLKIGYCAQNQETLNHSRTVLDEFLALGAFTEKEVFTHLSRFQFTWQDLSKRIGDLSGGEKNRLQIARVIMTGSTFLILDEPTNHMDIQSREALEDALADFRGTVLAVTHDRYFLDKIATHVAEIRDHKFQVYYGNFSEFWVEKQSALRSVEARVETRATLYRTTSSPGRSTRVSVNEDTETERKIIALEEEKARLESRLAEAFRQGDHREGRKLSSRLEEVSERITELYSVWGER